MGIPYASSTIGSNLQDRRCFAGAVRSGLGCTVRSHRRPCGSPPHRRHSGFRAPDGPAAIRSGCRGSGIPDESCGAGCSSVEIPPGYQTHIVVELGYCPKSALIANRNRKNRREGRGIENGYSIPASRIAMFSWERRSETDINSMRSVLIFCTFNPFNDAATWL